jgi:hypothetical protein
MSHAKPTRLSRTGLAHACRLVLLQPIHPNARSLPTYSARHARLACIVVLLLAACDGATDPGPQATATVLSHVDAVRLLTPAGTGSHPVECDVTYELLLSGAPVEWQSALFQYHFGADRTQVFGIVFMPGDTIAASWRQVTFNGRPIVGIQWKTGAEVPFSVTTEMTYIPRGESAAKVTRSRFSCGPEPSVGDGQPTINATVTPTTPVLPGAEIRVRYNASSTIGLWESAINVTGAFTQVTRYPENFQTTSSREVVITVPANAARGQPIYIAVSTTDPGLRSSFVTFTAATAQ